MTPQEKSETAQTADDPDPEPEPAEET